MHKLVADELRMWLAYQPHAKLADLGALNLNGAVKDLVPEAVGFDLLPGPGVDVVIGSGAIPAEHVGKYDAVTAVGVLGNANLADLANEILELLKPDGGAFFLATCSPHCDCHHSEPEGAAPDGNRPQPWQVLEAFGEHIRAGQFWFVSTEVHGDMIVIGRR